MIFLFVNLRIHIYELVDLGPVSGIEMEKFDAFCMISITNLIFMKSFEFCIINFFVVEYAMKKNWPQMVADVTDIGRGI